VRIALLFLFLILLPAQSSACSCAPYQGSVQSFLEENSIFIGRAVQTRSLAVSDEYGFAPTHETLFEVTKPISENLGTHFFVSHQLYGASCGIAFGEGDSVLVTAYKNADGSLETGLCHNQVHPALLLKVSESKIDFVIPEWRTCAGLDPDKAPPEDRLEDYDECKAWLDIQKTSGPRDSSDWVKANYP
jgi:hypothetical protein